MQSSEPNRLVFRVHPFAQQKKFSGIVGVIVTVGCSTTTFDGVEMALSQLRAHSCHLSHHQPENPREPDATEMKRWKTCDKQRLAD